MPFAVPPAITTRKPLSCEWVKVNWEHPMNRKLVEWFLCNEGQGPVHGLVGPTVLDLNATTTWGPKNEIGLQCDAVNEGASALAPSYLRIGFPLSMIIRGYQLGAVSAVYPTWGSVLHDNAAGAPYNCYGLVGGAAATYYYSWAVATGTTSRSIVSSVSPAAGPIHLVGTSIDAPSVLHNLYLNGVNIATGTDAIGSPPNYDTTAPVTIGYQVGVANRFPNALIYSMEIFSRFLLQADVLEHYHNPFGTPDNPRLI